MKITEAQYRAAVDSANSRPLLRRTLTDENVFSTIGRDFLAALGIEIVKEVDVHEEAKRVDKDLGVEIVSVQRTGTKIKLIRIKIDNTEQVLYATPESNLDDVVVTKNERGQIVTVTRQDEDGHILKMIADSAPDLNAVDLNAVNDTKRLDYLATNRLDDAGFHSLYRLLGLGNKYELRALIDLYLP